MPNVFVFSGHGEEAAIRYESREKVPDGVTLVTFAECKRVVKGNDLIGVLLAMKSLEPSLLEDPVANQDVLWKAFGGRHIHVHPPGSPLPKLYYNSRATHYLYDDEGHDGMTYVNSGVYKVPDFEIPIQPEWTISDDGTQLLHPRTQMKLPLRGNEYMRYAKLADTKVTVEPPYFVINPEVAASMYTGAVWPDPKTAVKHASARFGEEVWTPIQDVFKALGPGVYYWPICRGEAMTPKQEALAERVRAKSAQKRRETHGKGRRRNRKTARQPRRKRFL